MDNRNLQLENLAFAGTAGVSRNNRASGFTPAFLDKKTGLVEIARLKNGQPSPTHIISWLPSSWASRIAGDGSVIHMSLIHKGNYNIGSEIRMARQ